MGEGHESVVDTTLWLVQIPSEIGDEAAICDAVENRLLKRWPREAIQRYSHSLVVKPGPQRADRPTVGLFGHLDTVVCRQDGPARIEGDRLIGCGVSDMKSGLAIMIQLLERLDFDALGVNVAVVFYEREEGPYVDNGLGPLFAETDWLEGIDLAFCLEPSNNRLQMGSLGGLHATLRFAGQRAHSARPWQGENAIHKAGPLLSELLAYGRRPVEIDGLTFYEVMNATIVTGYGTRNVIPDRFELNVNYRFRPGKSLETAKAELLAWVDGRCEVVITDESPSGPVCLSNPLLAPMLRREGLEVQPKQAWTDVARLALHGIDAVNLGPGESAQAHQVNESCATQLIEEGYLLFESYLKSL